MCVCECPLTWCYRSLQIHLFCHFLSELTHTLCHAPFNFNCIAQTIKDKVCLRKWIPFSIDLNKNKHFLWIMSEHIVFPYIWKMQGYFSITKWRLILQKNSLMIIQINLWPQANVVPFWINLQTHGCLTDFQEQGYTFVFKLLNTTSLPIISQLAKHHRHGIHRIVSVVSEHGHVHAFETVAWSM